MFCKNCGKELDDNAQICPNCKTKCTPANLRDVTQDALSDIEKEIDSAVQEVADTLTTPARAPVPPESEPQRTVVSQPPTSTAPQTSVQVATPSYNAKSDACGQAKLKDDRGLASYIILSLVTCGIYQWYFIYKMAHDINIACEGDSESTSGLAAFVLLSIVTCGIYGIFWYYKLGNRLAANAPKYGLSFQENGTSILMWYFFGSMLCGIGPFVAAHILIKNSNKICHAYNTNNGLS